MLDVRVEPAQPVGYAWTARDGAHGPILAEGRTVASPEEAEDDVRRLFMSAEYVDMTTTYRNRTGRHEMIR